LSRSRRAPARHHGLLLVDKPDGLTSHDVVSVVRRLFGQRQVGHAGTLDPLATGLLPVLLGQGTKLSQWATADDKTYETTARLGQRTDTLDAEGTVVQKDRVPNPLDPAALEAALAPLRGHITQRVPAYSAVKVEGQRLYQRARAGETVDAPTRPVTIHELTSLGYTPPRLSLRVHCSKGTYIRQLVSDVGDALGCGAHVEVLRRTRVGALDVGDAIPLATLQASPRPETHLIGLRTWIARCVPCVPCDADAAVRTRQGQRLSWRRLGLAPLPPGTRFALVTDDALVALAEVPAADSTVDSTADSTGVSAADSPPDPAPGAGAATARRAYRLVRVFPAPTPCD
jgi:tRNA pseudouridine55 synthase